MALSWVAAATAQPPILPMEQVATLEGPSTDSMVQPTDVVVDSVGTVWALDGVNLRIAKFDKTGRFVAYIDLVERKRPEQIAPGEESLPSTATAGRTTRVVPELIGGRRSVPAEIFGPPEPEPTPAPETPAPELLRPPTKPALEKPMVPGDRLPVGLGIDRSGRLLVGNRYTGQIEIREADGTLVSVVAIPREPSERPADPTDVLSLPGGRAAAFLPLPDGRTTGGLLLVVDNDNHCIKVVDSAGRLVRKFGSRGSATGELQYPATAATAPGNRIVVADVLNARVDVFAADGGPGPPIGSRGITAGRFYRPKGVAVDRSGRVLVTDSFTGLVQVFDLDGRLAGIWGDSAGRPLRLRSPASIFVGESGRVYVVEMLANRISVWREMER